MMSGITKRAAGWASAVFVAATFVLAVRIAGADRSSSSGGGTPEPEPGYQDEVKMVGMRQAGQYGDRRWIPFMTAMLRQRGQPFYYPVALNALAQLGATEAIPDIRELEETRITNHNTNPVSYLTPYEAEARVALARLNAEHLAGPGEDNLPGKIRSFMQELSLSADQLNAAAAKLPPHPEKPGYPIPLEIRAMRVLADMVYQAHSTMPLEKLGLGTIDFSRDYPSALKLKLAPLSDTERLDWLIEEFSRSNVMYRPENVYNAQLIADHGPAAGRAAAAKLREMLKNPAHSTPSGIAAVCDVFTYAGTPDEAPLAAQLMTFPNQDIADIARSAYNRLTHKMTTATLVPAY